jgi:hypothetical protein
MKYSASIITAVIVSLFSVFMVRAQASETIWMTASATSFKTGETATLSINANSATPIQGFTFQIRYDPACLHPENATSPVPGMNGLLLPQTEGLVDASFASTTPQTANGILANVYFTTQGQCQTSTVLESAALVVKNEAGFASPLTGIAIGEKTVSLIIDSALGTPQEPVLYGTPLPLGVQPPPQTSFALPTGTMIVLAILGILILVGIFILIRVLMTPESSPRRRR